MSEKIKEPKDLGVKIGTPRCAFLTQIKNKMRQDIENCEKTIDVNSIIIERLDEEIKKENEKLKKKGA